MFDTQSPASVICVNGNKIQKIAKIILNSYDTPPYAKKTKQKQKLKKNTTFWALEWVLQEVILVNKDGWVETPEIRKNAGGKIRR